MHTLYNNSWCGDVVCWQRLRWLATGRTVAYYVGTQRFTVS